MKRVSSERLGGFLSDWRGGCKASLPPAFFFPSPLVGEGGSNERSEFETGEGSVSADRTPHPARCARHLLPQGRREEARESAVLWPSCGHREQQPTHDQQRAARRRG